MRRRVETDYKPDEKELNLKSKAIASMLARSENYWNKLTLKYKDVLISSIHIELFTCPYSVDYEKSHWGLAIYKEFLKGKAFVNTVDPTYLSIFYDNSLGKTESIKINLGKININLDDYSNYHITTQSLSDNEELKEEYQKFTKMMVVAKKADIIEGQEAVETLRAVGMDESVDPDCLLTIIVEENYYFIKFLDPDLALLWKNAFKILVKSQTMSYRGINEEIPNFKKEWSRGILRKKNVMAALEKYKFINWISDNNISSLTFREQKIFFLGEIKKKVKNISTEKNVFDVDDNELFVIVDIRKNFKKIKESYVKQLNSFGVLQKYIFFEYLKYIHLNHFLLYYTSKFDQTAESWGMSLLKEYTEDYEDLFLVPDYDREFWDVRRKVIKRYKSVNTDFVLVLFNDICDSISNEDSRLIKAFKVLQAQKQNFRYILGQDAKVRGKKRGKRGGKKMQRKELFQLRMKEKNVMKTTTNVLKLMMLEDSKPDLVPGQLKHSIVEKKQARESCCNCRVI